MADFVLEAGIKVASGGIDDLIREVQGELNKKKIAIPFTPDKYSVQAFAQRLTSELKKSEIEVRARANSQDVNAFINKLQEGLNKSSKLYLPFEPKSESVAAFAKKLQDEINKSDIKVEVKVDAKKAKEAASGADEATKAVNELNSAIDRYYKLVSRRETISFVGLNKKEVEDIDINLRRVTETLDRYGVSVSDLEDAYRNGNLVEYLNSLNLGTDEYGKTLKIVEDSIQRYSKSEGAAAEIIRKRAQAAMDDAQAEEERAAKEEARAAKAEEAEMRRAKALANAKAMEQADADAKRDNAKAEEELFAAGEKRLSTLNKTTKVVGQVIKAFIGFQSIIQLVRSLYQNVLDLDKAIVDLQIATGETRSTVSGMVKDYAKLGQQLGVTTVDITKAADSWLRQGYNAADSTKLITASTMLAKLGQIEMSAATDYLTSSMKGYGISAENVVDIVDKLSAVDLVSATSAGDLAAAMQKTAVTANQVGIPLNKLIGMIATISEVSQQSATTVGTAMKSMLARMVNIKAGFLSDPESGETLSNVEAALGGIGIALRDSNGDFREMSFILDELAGKWDTLTGLQQSAVAVALGGTRQQENVRILMEYWDQVNNLTSVAATSTGTAQEKFEAYSGGIEARMNALKAAWQGLSASVVNSALIKKAISFLTTIVSLFTEIGTVGRFAISGVAIGAGKEFVTAFKNMTKYGFSWADSLNIAITQVKFWFKELWTSIKTYWGNIVQLISANPYLIAIGALVALTAAAIKYSKTVQERFEESKEEFDGLSESIDANKKKLEELNKQIEENEALKGTSSWTDDLDKETSALHAQYIELQQVNAELEAQKKLKLNETLGNWAGTYSGGISTEKKADLFSFTNGVYARKIQDVSRDFVTNLVFKQLGLSYADAFKLVLSAEGNKSVKLPSGFKNPFKARDALKSIGLEFGWDNQDDKNSVWQYTAQTDDEYIDALTSRLDVYDEGSQQYWEARSKLIEMAGEYYKGIRAYEDLWGEEIKDADKLDSENFKVYQEMIKRRNLIELNLGNTSMFYYGTYAQSKNKASGKGATVSSSLRLVSLDLTQAESDAVKLKNAYVTVIKALNEDASLNKDLSVTGEEFADSANLLISNYASLADSFGVWQNSGMSNLELIGVIVEAYESAEEAQRAAAKSGGLKTLTSDLDSLSKEFDSEADFLEAIQKVRGDLDALDGMPSEFKEHINGILDSFVESKDIKAFYGEIIDEFALDDDAVIYIRDSWFTAAERIEEGPKELFEKFEGYVSTLESALSEDPEAVAKAKLGLSKFVEQVFGADSETFTRIDGWIQKVGNADYTIKQFKNDIAGMASGSAFESYVDFSWMSEKQVKSVQDRVLALSEATDDFEKASNRLSRNEAVKKMRESVSAIFGEDSGAYAYIDTLITMLDAGLIRIEDFRNEIYRLAESNEAFAPILEVLNFDWKKISVPPTTKDAFNSIKEVLDADWSVDRNSAIEKLASIAREFNVGEDTITAMTNMLRIADLDADKGSIIDMIVEFLQGSDIKGANELVEHLLALKDAAANPFDSFEEAVNNYDKAADAAQRRQFQMSLLQTAGETFGRGTPLYEAVRSLIYQLFNESIDSDEFKQALAALLSGTKFGDLVNFDWFEVKPKTEETIKSLINDIKSLKDASTEADRETIFNKIKKDVESAEGLTDEARQKIIDFATALKNGEVDADSFGNELWEIAGVLETIIGIPIRKYLEDAFKPAATEAEEARQAVAKMREEMEKLAGVGSDDNNTGNVVATHLTDLTPTTSSGNTATRGEQFLPVDWDDKVEKAQETFDAEFGQIWANMIVKYMLKHGGLDRETFGLEKYVARPVGRKGWNNGLFDPFNVDGYDLENELGPEKLEELGISWWDAFDKWWEEITPIMTEEAMDAWWDGVGQYLNPDVITGYVPNAASLLGLTQAEQISDQAVPMDRSIEKLPDVIDSAIVEPMEEATEVATDYSEIISDIITQYPELTEAAYNWVSAMEAGDLEEAEKWANIVDQGVSVAEAAENVSKLESAMSKLLGAESGSLEQKRAYGELLQLLVEFGYGPGTETYNKISDIANAFMSGAINADQFKEKIYGVLQVLSQLIGVDLTKLLSGSFTPESMESRLATATGDSSKLGMPSYSTGFMQAGANLQGLQAGQMLTSEDQQALLSQFPNLTDEMRKYAEAIQEFGADSTEASEALGELKNAFNGLLTDDMAEEFNSQVEKISDGLENLDEGSNEYKEGVESLADMYGVSVEFMEGHLDDLQDAIDGDADSWHDFVEAASKEIMIKANADVDTSRLMSGVMTVQELLDATNWTAEELKSNLIDTGMFEIEEKNMGGTIHIPELTLFGGLLKLPPSDINTQYTQEVLKPTKAFSDKVPKKRGGGGKKSPKSGGKTSILSEQYTNDKGLYDTLIDNLKNLNNLYEEGSEEWLRNQQRIIETYQAYAKTIQDEYDRLTKAGVSMVDKEMQTLSKDLLKVNKEIYDAAKEYWEAVRDNMKESMEHIVSQMDAVLDLRKAHKDLLTDLRQENRELEKQYKIAQDEAAHPGLTEAEHEMLFSSEDYKRLTGMLQDISKQADALYEEYKNKIASVTEDETYAISYITDEYERQLGLLESQYEIAKQQLAVEKARQELQNTLRERNTAVLINGAWTWMADPDAVQAAMEKVADAEVELEDAITDSEFNKETAEIETARDAIKSSIDAMEALEFAIEDLAEGIVDLADSINENIFNAIGTTSRNYLKQTKGHGLELFMDELTELQETSGLVFSNTDVEKLYSLLSSGNTINSSNIFDDSIVHDSAAIASILNNTTNNGGGSSQTVIINGLTLSDTDSEMLLNALERVSYTWQA